MTLTEFLLARIADRKAWADGMLAHALALVEMGEVPHADGAQTLVSECEALRRIVGIHSESVTECLTCRGDGGDEWTNAPQPCPTLRYLARPYAGHPDYAQEWKP